jgi:hypothetical protein
MGSCGDAAAQEPVTPKAASGCAGERRSTGAALWLRWLGELLVNSVSSALTQEEPWLSSTKLQAWPGTSTLKFYSHVLNGQEFSACGR